MRRLWFWIILLVSGITFWMVRHYDKESEVTISRSVIHTSSQRPETPKLAPFDPADKTTVVRRAKEILVGTRNLGEPEVILSAQSAHVFYQQKEKGIPVFPYGRISIDFRKTGAVDSLSSSWIHEIKIVNSLALAPAAAREIAIEFFGTPKIDFEQVALWTSQPDEKTKISDAKYAYRYFARGREAFFDAESGKLLATMNRRK